MINKVFMTIFASTLVFGCTRDTGEANRTEEKRPVIVEGPRDKVTPTTPETRPGEIAVSPKPDEVKPGATTGPMMPGTQGVQTYTYAQKKEFLDQMKKDIDVLDDRIDELSDRVDKSTGNVKTTAKAKVDSLLEKLAYTKNELDRAEDASEANWTNTVNTLQRHFTDLQKSVNDTRQWMDSNI